MVPIILIESPPIVKRWRQSPPPLTCGFVALSSDSRGPGMASVYPKTTGLPSQRSLRTGIARGTLTLASATQPDRRCQGAARSCPLNVASDGNCGYTAIMITELTKELREELAQHGEGPIRLVNPDTQRVYVLLDAEVFERVKALLSDDAFDVRDTYAAQDGALAKVWDDPELDAYADYDQHRPQT